MLLASRVTLVRSEGVNPFLKKMTKYARSLSKGAVSDSPSVSPKRKSDNTNFEMNVTQSTSHQALLGFGFVPGERELDRKSDNEV